MHDLVKIELFKIFKRPRTYIGFGAIALIVFMVQLGFYAEGERLLDFVTQNLKEQFIFEGKLINVYTVTYVILTSLWVHVPILVALVTGDLIAGEANGGTFRLILTRPISRTKFLFAKFFAGWTYVVMLIAFMFATALGIGYFIFGSGDLIVMQSTINIFNADDTLWRFGLSFLYSIMMMTVITSLSFMLSSFSDNSIGPIIGTIAIIIGVTIISTLGFSLLEPILPYVFTTYLPSWKIFFASEIDYGKLTESIIVSVSYIVVFLSITFIYFRKKDILS
jgi:ABC-2 type transport system permease protein